MGLRHPTREGEARKRLTHRRHCACNLMHVYIGVYICAHTYKLHLYTFVFTYVYAGVHVFTSVYTSVLNPYTMCRSALQCVVVCCSVLQCAPFIMPDVYRVAKTHVMPFVAGHFSQKSH